MTKVMTVGEFFLDRMDKIVFQAACILAAAGFLLITGTQPGIVLLLSAAGLPVFLIGQFLEFRREACRLKELKMIMDNLNERYLFAECVPKARSLYERKLFELFRLSGKSMIEKVSDARAAQREYREYVERWVHEIKTPITAAKLICQNTDSTIRRKLFQELAQIDAHVERALFYARAETAEKDFIVCRTELSKICNDAVEAHRTLLIQNGIRVEIKGCDGIVYTDGKWAVFMLGQLLQNAARYHGADPVITLSAERLKGQVRLAVTDNGIGIPAHELSRVFDRGFTGSNGRGRGGSTGMGLYLCRRLADALGIGLQIQSTEGMGTCVTFTFPAKKNLTEM